MKVKPSKGGSWWPKCCGSETMSPDRACGTQRGGLGCPRGWVGVTPERWPWQEGTLEWVWALQPSLSPALVPVPRLRLGSGQSQCPGYCSDWGVGAPVPLWALPVVKSPRAAPRAECKVRTRTEYSVCSMPVCARLCLLPPSGILGVFWDSKHCPKGWEAQLNSGVSIQSSITNTCLRALPPLLLANYPSRSISDCSVSWNCKEAARSHLGGRANIKPANSFFSPFVNEENMQVLSRADFSVHLHTLEKSAFN